MSTQTNFIQEIAPLIVQEAFNRGYKFPSAIIAQGCNESGYGESKLAKKYHNYFGLKCGSVWGGKSVNLTTKEEYNAGVVIEIKDNFRVYDNMAAGVKGYFDFIKKLRYQNLYTATSSKNYLEIIKSDGYATSSTYVQDVYAIVEKYGLLTYDNSTELSASEELESAITVIANYVIKGYFGNGHEQRKEKIYNLVRDKVNELCSV